MAGDSRRSGVGAREERMIGEYNIALMVVLALETATRDGSVALWDHGTCHARTGDDPRTHGERLPGELLAWLAGHARELTDVDLFAVVSGPGSFTGLRVGIAAVQGLALATGRPVVAVPTLDALAAPELEKTSEGTIVAPCLDGQRGEVFLAAYAAGPEGPRLLVEPMAGVPAEAADRLRDGADGRPIVLVGSGAVKYAEVFQAACGLAVIVPSVSPLAATAAHVAAGDPGRAAPPHALRPVYVRRPDAVIARDRARGLAPDLVVNIRRASGAEDLAAVAELQRATFTNAWGTDAIRWELEHTDVARLYVMHEPGGALVGYCACWMVFDELHINSLAVDHAWRRRGLARRLLRHILREAATAGARSATLEVRRSNIAALGLYERLGFHVEAARPGYYQDPPEDALILWHRVPTMW
jgi:tRNA threonylcarbamoyl adenosine modification protein YeaZ/ribosomal-protein-alanine acetyltransferase